DTDTDTDTDVDTGVEQPIVDCLPDHGVFSSASRWVYDWQNANRTGDRQISVSEYSPDKNEFALLTIDNWTNGSSSYTANIVESYRCDENGLYLLSRTFDSRLRISGFSDDVTSRVTTYTTAPLLRPNTPVLGETWTRRAVGTVTINGVEEAIDTTELFVVSEADVLYRTEFDRGFRHLGSAGTEELWIPEVGIAIHPTLTFLRSHTP
ncbi:MAG: hypothetical protein AAFV53_10185, partial [Myxococcota bacterium]